MQEWAEEQAAINSSRTNGQAHTRPNGNDAPTISEKIKGFKGSGENTVTFVIEWFEDGNLFNYQKVVDEHFRVWLESPSHKANMLFDKYTTFGFHYALGTNNSAVIGVQFFEVIN